MARFYVTTPIFYVNDAPHIGHAYNVVCADAFARWHRLIGDETWFLTGTDEHGLKVMRAAEAVGRAPREHADLTSARFREAWAGLEISNDDFIRTTEERHHRAVQEFLQRVYDNGHIYRATYEGLYNVSDEAYVTEAEVTPEDLASGRVMEMKEDNYFFRLSAFADRLLEWYEREPDAIRPAGRRNEAAGIVRQGLRDISITRTSIDWGVPVPWDDQHVFYVWYDALINYVTAVGYGSDPVRFERWWPAVTHLIGKDILRFHCVYWPAMLLAADIADLPRIGVHGWLLIGGEKMSKSKLNQIAPADLVADFGDRRLPLLHVARQPLRPRQRVLPRGPDHPLQHRPRQQPRQPAVAGRHGGRLEVRRRSAPSPRPTRRWRRSPPTCWWRRPRGGRTSSPPSPSRRRGGSSATPTRTSRPTSRGRPSRARRSTQSSAMRWRYCGWWRCWPPRPCPPPPPTSGPASVCRAHRTITPCRAPGHGAATPAGCRSAGGRRSSPGSGTDGSGSSPDVPWFDHHCHLDIEEAAGALAAAREAGVERLLCVGTDRATTDAAVAVAAAHPGSVWATAGCHPHEARHGWDWLDDAIRLPGVIAVGEAGLDHHYDLSPRQAQRDAFAAQIELANRTDLPLVIHTREAWEETLDLLDAGGVPRRTVFHCFTGGVDEADACLRRGAHLSFSGIASFPQGGRRPGRRRPLPPRPPAGGDRLAVPGAGPAPGPPQPAGMGRRRRAGRRRPPSNRRRIAGGGHLGDHEPVLRAARHRARGGRPVVGAVTHTRRQLLDLLERHDLQPSRALGQNFVADPNTVRRIARLARVGPGDRVLEIGAGTRLVDPRPGRDGRRR